MHRSERSIMEPTDLEKKSLESHVELCAARFQFLEEKLETVDKKVDDMEKMTKQIHECVIESNNQRQNLQLRIAGGVIAVLLAVAGWAVSILIVG